MESPRIAVASPVPSTNGDGLVARGVADRLHHGLGAEIHVAVHHEGRDRRHVAVDHRPGDAGLDARQRRRRGGHDHVAAQHQVGAAGGDAHGVQVFGLGREAHVAHHRAVLLGQAREVEHGAALALEMGRHADQRADGDHAGAADAGHQDAVGLRQRPHGRHGELRRRDRPARPSAAGAWPWPACRHAPTRSSGRSRSRRRSPCCSCSGRSGACGRARSRAASPTRSCSCRSSRRSPRTPRR